MDSFLFGAYRKLQLAKSSRMVTLPMSPD